MLTSSIFTDVTSAAKVADGDWGWGACFIDFENDGDLDIYQTNGWDLEGDFSSDTSHAFEGIGNGEFVEVSEQLGLADSEQGRGVVCADFDGDGDVDIFQLHRGSPVSATMWRNESSGGNAISIKLNGLGPNTEAAGARIVVTVGQSTQTREINIGSNFVSQNPTIQVFGIGDSTQVDEVRIEWPEGSESVLQDVAAGQILTLDHPLL